MSDLTNRLIKSGAKNPHKKPSQPVWSGPDGKGDNGGITFSLLSRFLVCRERFRLRVIEGLGTQDQFNHRIEYGNMWHICEEAYLGCDRSRYDPLYLAMEKLKDYCGQLCRRYRTAQQGIKHWYQVCRRHFSVYVGYWEKVRRAEKKVVTNLLQETAFDVPYSLPSGRTVRLRGKWDSVDLVKTKGGKDQLWLQENKTKGDINEQQLQRQLTFDLQTMIYTIALLEYQHQSGQDCIGGEGIPRSASFDGIRYNVIRRPLSGGKYSIKQHQPTKTGKGGETEEDYYNRLQGLIENDPDYFFMRWNVLITNQDVEKFKTICLNPILEQLCDWWEFMSGMKSLDTGEGNQFYPLTEFNTGKTGSGVRPWIHWRHPNGVFNPLDEGGCTDVDEYLYTGSMVGLERIENLFPELTPH